MEKFKESQLILFELYSESNQKKNNKNYEITPPKFGKSKILKSKQNDKDKEMRNECNEDLIKLSDKLKSMKEMKMEWIDKIEKSRLDMVQEKNKIKNDELSLNKLKDKVLETKKLKSVGIRSVEEMKVLKISNRKRRRITHWVKALTPYYQHIIIPCVQGMKKECAASKNEI